MQSWLRIHDACRGLSDEDFQLIVESAEVETPESDDIIHQAGQPLAALYLVLRGSLKMSIDLRNGEESTIRYIGHGDQFGALGLASDEVFPVNVIAEDPPTLLRFDRETALRLTSQLPLFRRNLFRMIGSSVKQTLIKDQKASVAKIVTFVCFDEQSRTIVNQVAERLASIGEQIGYLSSWPSGPGNQSVQYKSLLDSGGEFISEPEARQIVGQWKDFDRVFFVIDESRPNDKFERLVNFSDSVFFITSSAGGETAVNDLKKLILASPTRQRKTHFAWLLGEDEQVAPLVPELAELVVDDFKICLGGNGIESRLYRQGVERIVHHLRGVKIGLALSGGAAHGMTHLGVLKALEEAGITIDLMAGTSAGVLTGVIYCAGYSPDWGIEHFTRDLKPGSFYKMLPQGDAFYMLAKYRTHGWDPMLRKYVHDWHLEQFPIPIQTVTTDLVSAHSVVRTTGDAVNALLESINLPGLAAPICRNGKLLVDGGILNNLPADVLVKSNCNFVIGIDVSANIDYRVGKNTPESPTEMMKAPGSVTTILRCLNVQAHNMSSLGSQSADVVIAPNVSSFESTAFTKTPEMAEIGYQETMKTLPRIREILNEIDANLFEQ